MFLKPFKTLFKGISYQCLEEKDKECNKYMFVKYDYVVDLTLSDNGIDNEIPIPIVNKEVAKVAKDVQTQPIKQFYSNVIEAFDLTLDSSSDNKPNPKHQRTEGNFFYFFIK